MNIRQVCNILLVSLFAWNILSCSSCGNTDTNSKSSTQIDIEKQQNDSVVRFIDDNKVLLRKVLMPGVSFDSDVEINGKSYYAFYVIIIPKETDVVFSSCCCEHEYGLDRFAIDSFAVEPGNPRYSSVDGVLFSADTSLLILVPHRRKSYKVPTSTKKIEEYAFQFSNIEEIELPEGLEIIGDEAFSGCHKLKHVKLPSTVKELGEDAFGCYRTRYECVCDNSIEDVEIPKNSKLEKLGDRALYFAKHVYIPKYLTQKNISDCFNSPYVEVDAENPVYCSENGILFSKDKGILYCIPNRHYDELVIPSSVKKIEDIGWLEGIDKLVFNDHIEEIKKITTHVGEFIIRKDENCNSNHSKYCVVDGVLFSADTTMLIAFPALSKRDRYIVPKQVKVIGEGAFRNAKISSLVLPDGLKIIQDDAFAYCDNLKRIDIPLTVERIEGKYCFLSDSSKKVFIPQNIIFTEELEAENVEFIELNDEAESMDE